MNPYKENEAEFISTHNLSEADLFWLKSRGKSLEDLIRNYRALSVTPQFLRIIKAVESEDELRKFSEVELESLSGEYEQLPPDQRPAKFTPMSGAASRMFGVLDKFLHDTALTELESEKLEHFFQGLDDRSRGPKFPFIHDLRQCVQRSGDDYYELLDGHIRRKQSDRQTLIRYLLDNGLNYKNMPKGLIPFHWQNERDIVPLEGHIREAFRYGASTLYLTVSPEHREMLESGIKRIKDLNPELRNVNVILSEQQGCTDSIAIDAETGALVRDLQGRLAFFPSGHGALLHNLPDRPVILRNVDNFPKSPQAQNLIETYHKGLAVVLARYKTRVSQFREKLRSHLLTESEIFEFLDVLNQEKWQLLLDRKSLIGQSYDTQKILLEDAFSRPVKIVGVVLNQGEPGGGPFVIDYKGRSIISIVEKDEISESQKSLILLGRYFNPVDILCDTMGQTELTPFVNHDRYFIVEKPYKGKSVRRMELPGLWNGAMDGWNALFVELPLQTFAPVKEVNDLLRPEHQ